MTIQPVGVEPELRNTRLAFVEDLNDPCLCVEDVTHFRKVLRMGAGERLNASDGLGSWRPVKLGESGAALTPVGEVRFGKASKSTITIAFAPTKGDRPEWTVQKLTELGVDRIVAVRTERSIVHWSEERSLKQALRWQKVAREASMQSRRVYLPNVSSMVDLAGFLADNPSAVLCEPGGRRMASSDTILVIGPEGGFTPSELESVGTVELPVPAILRSETAALVAATAVQGLLASPSVT